jgi:hypothetical protein
MVGGSGLLVDMGVLYLLADVSRLGLNITMSKICAAEVAMISNFIWNELWTFRQNATAPLTLSPSEGERDGVRGPSLHLRFMGGGRHLASTLYTYLWGREGPLAIGLAIGPW